MSIYAGRGIHGQVVDALGMRIFDGSLAPGDVIDPEAILREFGVSRTVVREAFKVLSAKGLVDARPRTGTFITERSRWQLLDADVMSWRSRGAADTLLMLELGEVRQVIEPYAARMAASRRTDEHVAQLESALEEVRTWDGRDFADLVTADLAFHRLVLLAAGNELLQRFEVILEPALQARDTLLHHRSADTSFLDAHVSVLDAIRRKDANRAHELMAALMSRAAKDAEVALAKTAKGKKALRHRVPAL